MVLIVGLRAPESKSTVDLVVENGEKSTEHDGQVSEQELLSQPAGDIEKKGELAEPEGPVMTPSKMANPVAEGIMKKGKPVKHGKEFQYDNIVLIPALETLQPIPWAGIIEPKRTMIVGEVLCESFIPTSFHLGPGLRDVTCPR